MTSRRAFVSGLGAAGLLSVPRAEAALKCVELSPTVQSCDAGMDSRVPAVEAQQKDSQWCWAACISAVFALHGYRVAQSRIVEQVFSEADTLPAYGQQVADATTGAWETKDGTAFGSTCEVLWDSQFWFGRPDAARTTARELADGNPLIIGAGGHAMVLTAISYIGEANRGTRIQRLLVRDPWPGKGRRLLHPKEIANTTFLAKVTID